MLETLNMVYNNYVNTHTEHMYWINKEAKKLIACQGELSAIENWLGHSDPEEALRKVFTRTKDEMKNNSPILNDAARFILNAVQYLLPAELSPIRAFAESCTSTGIRHYFLNKVIGKDEMAKALYRQFIYTYCHYAADYVEHGTVTYSHIVNMNACICNKLSVFHAFSPVFIHFGATHFGYFTCMPCTIMPGRICTTDGNTGKIGVEYTRDIPTDGAVLNRLVLTPTDLSVGKDYPMRQLFEHVCKLYYPEVAAPAFDLFSNPVTIDQQTLDISLTDNKLHMWEYSKITPITNTPQ